MIKIITTAFISFLLLGCTQEDSKELGKELASQMLIIDTHIDVPYRLLKQHQSGREIDDISELTTGDFDFIKAKRGGLNLPFFSIYLPAETEEDGTAFEVANSLIDMVEDIVTLNPDKFTLIDSTERALSLNQENNIGLVLVMENGAPIESDLSRVQFFYDRGIRYITLTHSKTNHISDSSYDENIQWGGLSDFGRQLIREMNLVGVMVDISHVNDEAFYQAIETSNTPVIASHSSLRHFTPGFERNVDDDMLKALAKKGGVIHINFGSSFVSKAPSLYFDQMKDYLNNHFLDIESASKEEIDKAREEFMESNPFPYANVSIVADHIDRAVNLVGIDHVGLGSDFDGVGDSLPEGLKDVSMYPNLINELLTRGYTKEDLKKILSGNLLRVWKQVESYARDN
jgi:membrane dipeptidase